MRTIAITYTPILSRVMMACAGIIVIALFTYGFLLLEAVGNTADRAAAERQIQDLSSRISTLEEQYLAYTREMTPERATEMGLVKPASVSTVFATAASRSLSALTGVR